MTARDRFSVPLKCPSCGKAGTARLSQTDGIVYLKGDRATSVEEMPDGFRVTSGSNWYTQDMDIACADCSVSAVRQA